ncbi:MAG TPA: hypothetical protein VJY34_03655 [Roseiarcus sp.]|nr:hypothetical protein [Roseiarcus sp.]
MKFGRLACGCCKSGDFPSLCKSPTYVLSEVVENSNVVFLLMSKRGRTTCGESLSVDRDPARREPQDVTCERGLPGPAAVISPGRRPDEILAACWRPSYRLAGNDDFEPGESPIRRNQRLLEEGSGFWPRRRPRDADAVLREQE